MENIADYLDKLRNIQNGISEKIFLEDNFIDEDKKVGGIDQAFIGDEKIISAFSLFNENLDLVEDSFALKKLDFPYIPGYLAFREAPAIFEAYRNIENKVNLLFVDGSGFLHPRFAGLATHVGVKLDIPTIGVIKNLLCGEIEKEVKEVGDASKIIYKGKKVGYAFKSKEGCNPIYISPGHKISIETSLKMTKKYIKNHKLPKPIYKAHLKANKIKNSMK